MVARNGIAARAQAGSPYPPVFPSILVHAMSLESSVLFFSRPPSDGWPYHLLSPFTDFCVKV